MKLFDFLYNCWYVNLFNINNMHSILRIWIFEIVINNCRSLILFWRNLFVRNRSSYWISWHIFGFLNSEFSWVRPMVFMSILRSNHHHHSLHELNIGHLTVFSYSHNGSSFAFWMFIGAILASAAGSEFAFNIRVKKQAFFSVWACRKIFALFCRVYKWTLIIVCAAREKFASDLFFCYLFWFKFLLLMLVAYILKALNLIFIFIYVSWIT